MTKKIIGLVSLLLIAYLLFWPVVVEPIAWQAPKEKGYVEAFTPNELLANLELMDIGEIHGPEDVTSRVIDGELMLYISSQDGLIRKINPQSKEITTFADTQGVPLGLEFDANDNLIVADAYRGLLSITPNGQVQVLTNRIGSSPILYADDLDIAKDGMIYFSDASTKFGAEWSGSTMQGSVYEILEHGRTGRLLAYDPATQQSTLIKEDLSFANGVAMGPNDESVFVIETGEYRILRIWVKGEKLGQSDVVIDNLPGFPDNINRAPQGYYYVGLVSKRSKLLDKMSGSPFLRKVTWRLPEFMKPKAQDYGMIFEMSAEGEVLQNWQDPSGAYPATTGAHNPGDGYLYISSLTADKLGRMRLDN